jgi:hypothetical protein
LTSDVLTLLKNELPADAFCMLALTMEDLYPEPSWNFVFGQASPQERVGIFSFARPVCLRKLHSSIGFDMVDRYGKLLQFYKNAGFVSEARWVAERIDKATSC